MYRTRPIRQGFPGGSGPPPAPLQVPNGRSNPGLPEEARLEVPTRMLTRIEKGKLLPETVPRSPLPDWLHAPLATLAVQRSRLAGWLSGGNARPLPEILVEGHTLLATGQTGMYGPHSELWPKREPYPLECGGSRHCVGNLDTRPPRHTLGTTHNL